MYLRKTWNIRQSEKVQKQFCDLNIPCKSYEQNSASNLRRKCVIKIIMELGRG